MMLRLFRRLLPLPLCRAADAMLFAAISACYYAAMLLIIIFSAAISRYLR